jgi:hypothetical protein
MKKSMKVETYRPPKAAKTRFIRVLDGWREFAINFRHADGSIMPAVFIASPQDRIYRRALHWENPSLVIDANILPPEHHIRLVRIRDAKTIKLVRRALRHIDRLNGKRTKEK